jgi:hypothetical protein
MDIRHDYFISNIKCRDQNTYNQAINQLEEIFHEHGHKLPKVKELALNIKDGIERLSPFIQQNTQAVCPDCKDVCCINKHGYYNYEDLIYISALGLKLPPCEFRRKDSDPCQFLTENGCSMERSFRPSGCNWYFCDSLFDRMEKLPEYQEFDNSLQDVVDLWMELMKEFVRVGEEIETAE